MGVADLPRVTFNGFTYWSPSTMNNNDYQPTYDPASATLDWAWLERHGLQDPDAFDAYATQGSIVSSANDAMLTPAGFFADRPPAEWNYYGDNRCGFVQPDEPVIEWPAKFSKPVGDTTVSGFTDERGNRITTGDPWIGQPVHLGSGPEFAKLVDVDPVAPWSSQIFADTFGLGILGGPVGVVGRTDGRAHSRWVFFQRNLSQEVIIAGVAAAMWQLALPTAGLSWFEPSPASSSAAAQLRKALGRSDVRGLMVRWVTYHTIYFQGSEFKNPNTADWRAIVQLYHEYATQRAKYEQGVLDTPPPRPVNRAYSDTVGWIAPWTTADMRSAPTGRILHAVGPVPAVAPAGLKTTIGPSALEFALDTGQPRMVSRIALDLGSAIPEFDGHLTKVDFGTLELAIEPTSGSGAAKPFAQVPYAGGYDKASYLSSAGVVDIPASQFTKPLSAEDIRNRLVIQFAGPTGTVMAAREADWTAETDDRAVYLDEPGPSVPPDREVVIQVRYRGGRPQAGATCRIAQYGPLTPGFNEADWQLVSATNPASQTPFARFVAGTVTDGAYVTVPVSLPDDALPYGIASVRLAALRSGPPVLQFTAFAPGVSAPPPPATIPFLNTAEAFFANVRVLPFHGAMAAAFENWLRTGPSVDLVTQRAFDAVFRTFFLMYPAMRFIRDPLQFQAWRGLITAATDPRRFETAAYMPVTRSLTAGQRRILELWNTYLDGELPTPVPGEPRGRRS